MSLYLSPYPTFLTSRAWDGQTEPCPSQVIGPSRCQARERAGSARPRYLTPTAITARLAPAARVRRRQARPALGPCSGLGGGGLDQVGHAPFGWVTRTVRRDSEGGTHRDRGPGARRPCSPPASAASLFLPPFPPPSFSLSLSPSLSLSLPPSLPLPRAGAHPTTSSLHTGSPSNNSNPPSLLVSLRLELWHPESLTRILLLPPSPPLSIPFLSLPRFRRSDACCSFGMEENISAQVIAFIEVVWNHLNSNGLCTLVKFADFIKGVRK